MARLATRLSFVAIYQLLVGAGLALAHCPEIHKACDRPIRTCQTNTDCPGDGQCVDAVCDTSVSTATRCFVTVVHTGGCTENSSVTGAFDVLDFPTVADVRVPSAGSLPIVEVSGNAACAPGPSLPCVVGFAGSTDSGLPGVATPGLVSFVSEHTLSASELQDLRDANATQLDDQATVTLQGAPTPTNLQVVSSSPVVGGCSLVNDPGCAGVDIDVKKSASCECNGNIEARSGSTPLDGDLVVCGHDDDGSSDGGSHDGDSNSGSHHGDRSVATAAGTHGHGDQGSNDHGSNDQGSNDQGSDDQGSNDHGGNDQGSDDQGSNDHGSDDGGVPPPDGSPAGCIVDFTVTVTNHGSETATNVVVSDVLPSALIFIGASASQGTFDFTTGTWQVGALSGGASATLLIDMDRGDALDQCIENCVELVSVDQSDADASNDSDCVTVFTGRNEDGTSDGRSGDSESDSSDDGASTHRAAGLSATDDGRSGDSESDSGSEDGPKCVPAEGGEHHVCDELVPAKWSAAYERWSRLLTQAAQANSHRQAAIKLRKAKGMLRKMQQITKRFERRRTVSPDCLGKLRSRLEALGSETRRIAQ